MERRDTPREREGTAAAPAPAPRAAENPVEARRRADFAAMQAFRPGYRVLAARLHLPDGSIAFGSAVDGRLLATFPARASGRARPCGPIPRSPASSTVNGSRAK